MMNQPVLTRRDFVRGTVSATLGASVMGALPVAAAESKGTSKVWVVRDAKAIAEGNKVNGEALKQVLSDTICSLTGAKDLKEGWLSLFKPDDKIGLVTTPHLNPTHKELEALVKASLAEAGIPEGNILDAQGGPDKPEACTALISMPALKPHWLTGMGTVLKNYITFSGHPADYHDQNNAKLGEIWDLPAVKGKTRLILVDALRPLCDKGPQPDPRYLWNYGGLIAGTDPVAVEAVCLNLITKKREELRGEAWPITPPPLCVEAADTVYKLGTSKMENIEIVKLGWQDGILL